MQQLRYQLLNSFFTVFSILFLINLIEEIHICMSQYFIQVKCVKIPAYVSKMVKKLK